MKILVDTNVLLSSIIDNSQCYELLLQVRSKHDIYYTAFILAEFRYVLLNKFKLNISEISDILKVIEEHYTKGESAKEIIRVSRDKNDDHVLADALKNNIEVIITGDKDLLILKSYHGIKILSPADFTKYYL